MSHVCHLTITKVDDGSVSSIIPTADRLPVASVYMCQIFSQVSQQEPVITSDLSPLPIFNQYKVPSVTTTWSIRRFSFPPSMSTKGLSMSVLQHRSGLEVTTATARTLKGSLSPSFSQPISFNRPVFLLTLQPPKGTK